MGGNTALHLGYSVRSYRMTMNVNGAVNVAADPRFFPAKEGYQAMTSFAVASSRRVNGENLFDGYFDVAVYGKQAETVAETVKKGDRVIVIGRLKQTKRQDGSYHVGVVAYSVAQSLEFAHTAKGSDESEDALAAAEGPARDELGRFVAAG